MEKTNRKCENCENFLLIDDEDDVVESVCKRRLKVNCSWGIESQEEAYMMASTGSQSTCDNWEALSR